jgi:hypothetical protein
MKAEIKKSELSIENNVLNFIKNYLNVKSKITLKHTNKNFDSQSMSQQMASVSYNNDNNYVININFNDTKHGFVRRLAHELIHVKQMEGGRLKVINNEIQFDDEVYTKNDYIRLYHSDKIPKFEEEAFEQEKLIANLYWNK